MRRKDREIKDFDEIVDILSRCQVIHLAMISDNKPYCIPLNFGYKVFDDGADGKRIAIYFHGAKEGKKITALTSNPTVSFCAETSVETSPGKDKFQACSWSCYYESVVGFGEVSFVKNADEKAAALDTIMFHNGYQLPPLVKKIAYGAMSLANTFVAKIDVKELTGKKHKK